MKIAFFNSKPYDLEFFNLVNAKHGHIINYYPTHLTLESVALIRDETVVCAFINDCLDEDVLHALKKKGIDLIALRSAGFNHVDLVCAKQLSLPVVRVSSYSPYAIAEHAVGLLQCLNLIGFDLHGKTVGVVGTGNIGQAFIRIMLGFGCKVLAFDPVENDECIKSGVQYLPLERLFEHSDIISLHCPLTPQTHHLIDSEAIALMKDDVTIINTSRGKLIDTKAIIQALKLSKIGLLGLDVYEEEEDIFFEDLSSTVLQDDQLSRLLTFPNVIITSHQAFFTKEAMLKIAQVTLSNISRFEHDGILENEVVA